MKSRVINLHPDLRLPAVPTQVYLQWPWRCDATDGTGGGLNTCVGMDGINKRQAVQMKNLNKALFVLQSVNTTECKSLVFTKLTITTILSTIKSFILKLIRKEYMI